MVFSRGLIDERLEKLRKNANLGVSDAVFIPVLEGYNWQSCYYFSGFRGSSGAVIITRDRAFFLTDARYTLQASGEVPFEVVDRKRNRLLDASVELMKKLSVKRIGIQGDKIPTTIYWSLKKESEIFDVSREVATIRRTKSKEEVALIRKACELAHLALGRTVNGIKGVKREKELDALLEYNLAMVGADGGWQDHKFIVASGARSALPHGKASDKEFTEGEWITVDFGARYEGYVCDITRNIFLGEIPKEWQDRHELLLEAQDAAAQILKPGVKAKDVDWAARRVLEKAGYEKFFTHGTGHGIGLDVHESPIVSFSSEDALQVGDVITLEPGIYVNGVGGMRIEDNYLITPDGAECISDMIPKNIAAFI
ncbi:Xaa-Pro peptidase family protein [Thermovirga sp.]|uniref:M24 family metallopeptidase n=1 Tax=Thermovirga sp. TaxID=2699834 RepID=UPI001852A18F|nr:aminopeptidase P family protein [Thermovirga sp.]MBO8153376.1 M24 family metallopeptidase [Thermovirga sp.]HDH97638.1 M24 family metallopeptidase [Deltaproteobacteria bacterium]